MVERGLEFDTVGVRVQAQLDALAAFDFQRRVADLDAAGSHVQAGGVQLLVCRRALGVVHRKAQVQCRPDAPDPGQRGAGGVEAALGLAIARTQAAVVMAGAQFQLELAKVLFLQHKEAGGTGIGARHEGFGTIGAETGIGQLQAKGAVPAIDGLLHGLQAGFQPLVGEAGDRLAILQFMVLVIGPGAAQMQPLQPAGRVVQAGTEFGPVADHVHPHHRIFGMHFIGVCIVAVVIMSMSMSIFAMDMGAERDAVLAAIGAQRQPGIGLITEPGSAHPAGAGGQPAVAQPAIERSMLLIGMAGVMIVVIVSVLGQQRRAGNPGVVGIADQAVHMQHPVVIGHAVQAEHPAALVVDAVAAQFGAATERALRQFARDPAIGQVHRPAHRSAAEQQGGRALEHLDLVSQERLDAAGMVRAQTGGIDAGQAIAQYLHARTILATDDRPADAGAEAGVMHTGQVADGLAQGGALGAVQRFAGQHADRTGQ